MRFNRLARIFLTLIVVFLAAISTAAQSEDDAFIPVDLGDVVAGTLTEQTYQMLYTFDAEEETFVTIRLESADFDTYLVLLASDNTVLDEDDDSGGDLDSLIELALPADDTYTIIVTSLRAYRSEGNLAATGDFTLRLNADDAPAPALPSTQRVDGGSIAYDRTVRGEISESFEPVAYTFEASAGDVVTITASSDDFDIYLFLEKDGNILIRDDDSGGDSDAQIEGFELPGGGTYTIVVDSFGNVINTEPESGLFTLTLAASTLSLEQAQDPAPTPQPHSDQMGEIRFGDPVAGSFTGSVLAEYYTFSGEVGDIITLEMRSFSIDSYLRLLDGDGNIILEDDDGAGELNARIGPFELTEAGVYTIEATTYSYVYSQLPTIGEYSLQLEYATVTEVNLDDTITGELNSDQPFEVYRFEATSGDVITISFEVNSFAVFLSITGAGGSVDQQTYGGSEFVGPIVLPEDGGYVITVSSYDTFEPMSYSLEVESITPIPITYDTTEDVAFGEENARILTFSGKLGDVINIIVDSNGGVDTSVSISTAYGELIASDDDSGEGLDPELTGIVLTEDGDYSIVIQPYIPGDTGTITVALQNEGVQSINEEVQIVRISDKQGAGSVVFDGNAGETVRLNVRPLTEAGAEPVIIVSQDGVELARNSVGQVERLILEFTVPADGPVNVRVEEIYSFNAILEFTLERIE